MTAAVVARRARETAPSAALVAAAAVVGLALVAVGERFGAKGPLVYVLIPLVPAAAAAVLARPEVGIVLTALVFPVGFAGVPGVPLQLVQVTALGVAVLVVLRRLAQGVAPLPWSAPLWWVLALLGWMVVGLPSAVDQHRAVREITLLGTELLFACAVVAACRDARQVRTVLGWLVAVVVAGAVVAPLQTGDLQSQFAGAVVRGRATGFFPGKPNTAGIFYAVGVFAAVALFLGSPSRRARRAAGVATTVIVVALLLTLSRGAWIGFALGCGVLYASLPGVRRALALAAPPVLLAALAFGAFAPETPQVRIIGERVLSLAGERNPYDDRPAIWAEAAREVRADPWTGQGAGGFPVASERGVSESQSVFADHAHNFLLTWAAETGVPGVLLLLGLTVHMGLLARQTARRARAAGRPWDAALVVALAAGGAVIVGEGLVEYPGRISVIVFEFWVVLGALLAMARLEGPAAAR